nr:hypothetical protein [Tanacetum cinerariifolium]
MTSIEDVNSFFARYTTSNNLISTGSKQFARSANHGVLGSLRATLFKDSRGKVSLISLGSKMFSYGFSKCEQMISSIGFRSTGIDNFEVKLLK